MCLNVSVVKLCLYVSECVCSKIIKELPGLVGSGTPCIFIQQIQVLNILNMLYILRFFPSKCSLFHNANLFGSCIIQILYTGCTKIKKNNSGAKGLTKRLIFFSKCAEIFISA